MRPVWAWRLRLPRAGPPAHRGAVTDAERRAAWVARRLAEAPALTAERVAVLRAILRPGSHASSEALERRLRGSGASGGVEARSADKRASGSD